MTVLKRILILLIATGAAGCTAGPPMAPAGLNKAPANPPSAADHGI